MTNTIAQVVEFERVLAVCDADKVIPEHPAPTDPPPFRGEITFEHVAFSYDPAVPALRDITFPISPGQMVGIVGPTGSGKPAVASLIPRFRDADAGSGRQGSRGGNQGSRGGNQRGQHQEPSGTLVWGLMPPDRPQPGV